MFKRNLRRNATNPLQGDKSIPRLSGAAEGRSAPPDAPRARLIRLHAQDVDDGACRSVKAAIARITEIERGGGRSVAMLAYDDGDARGTSEADLKPETNRPTGNGAAFGWTEAAGGAQ